MIPSVPRRRAQTSRLGAGNTHRPVTLFGTLHSPSRETELGDDAKQSVSVPEKHVAPFPRHVRQYFRQLEANVDSLERLFKNVSTFTQTEAFRAQHDAVAQLVKCCEVEIDFLSKKLGDSEQRSQAPFESPKDKSSLVGWNSVYCNLASLGRVCGAGRAAIFVIPAGCVVSSDAELAKAMKLSSFVSSAKLTPLEKGALHADVLEIAVTVASTRCSVNAKAVVGSRRAKQGFSTILACPILNPRGSGSPFGVVVLMDKVPPPGGSFSSKMFSAEDEARLSHGAELIAEVLDSFSLISASPASFLSPTNFENTWNVATHEDTVLRRVFQDAPHRGYIFRDDGVAPTTAARHTEMTSSRQRVMISHSSQIVDALKRCEDLESDLKMARDALSVRAAEIASLEERLVGVVHDRDRTRKSADGMRMANELILRNTFVVANGDQIAANSITAAPSELCDLRSDHEENEYALQKKFKNVYHGLTVGPQSLRRSRRI
jgi:hypothetical protein